MTIKQLEYDLPGLCYPEASPKYLVSNQKWPQKGQKGSNIAKKWPKKGDFAPWNFFFLAFFPPIFLVR